MYQAIWQWLYTLSTYVFTNLHSVWHIWYLVDVPVLHPQPSGSWVGLSIWPFYRLLMWDTCDLWEACTCPNWKKPKLSNATLNLVPFAVYHIKKVSQTVLIHIMDCVVLHWPLWRNSSPFIFTFLQGAPNSPAAVRITDCCLHCTFSLMHRSCATAALKGLSCSSLHVLPLTNSMSESSFPFLVS